MHELNPDVIACMVVIVITEDINTVFTPSGGEKAGIHLSLRAAVVIGVKTGIFRCILNFLSPSTFRNVANWFQC